MLGALALIGWTALAGLQPDAVSLADLTPAEALLPSGCRLMPAASAPTDSGRVALGLWGGLNVSSNPWIGDDPPTIAKIRERMFGLAATPDGPPLDRRRAASYRLHLADGIDQAYAAFYRESSSQADVHVYALKFADAARAAIAGDGERRRDDRSVTTVRVGGVVAVVSGQGECADSIRSYLKSRAQR